MLNARSQRHKPLWELNPCTLGNVKAYTSIEVYNVTIGKLYFPFLREFLI